MYIYTQPVTAAAGDDAAAAAVAAAVESKPSVQDIYSSERLLLIVHMKFAM